MAIQKPYSINLQSKTIAAEEENLISWQVSGSISTSFAISIINNTDGATIWSLPQTTSYATQYNLPANTILNGNEYKITITVWDDAGSSATSDAVIFQTSSRPTVNIDTIGTVASPNYTFTASYSQSENVTIKSWIAYLYDSNLNKLTDSGIKITSTLEYVVNNLQSEKLYYIEFYATSSKGLIGTSGKVSFNVLYTQPNLNLTLNAENTLDAGIKLSWNVTQIIGTSTPSPPTYINNEKVDLTADGDTITFSEGFSVDRNFTLKIWLENVKNKEKLLSIKGENGELYLEYHVLDNKFHLYKKVSNGLTTSWQSNVVVGSSFFVYIQQIGDLINIGAEEII